MIKGIHDDPNEKYYFVTIPARPDEARIDTVLNYIDITLFENVKELDGTHGLGAWAREVLDRFDEDLIELVWIEKDENATDIFYNTEENTICHLTEEKPDAELLKLCERCFETIGDPWTEERAEQIKYYADAIQNRPAEIISALLDAVEMWQKLNDEK